MLYKKYHRSYIRQFKLGTKIIIGFECGVVIEELVYWSGRLVRVIYVV